GRRHSRPRPTRSWRLRAERLGRPCGHPRWRPRLRPQIGQALAALHDRPAVNWTLTELAGMSRTQFAARFRAAVGESPMRHLAKIRLGQAAGHLTTTRLSVAAIARRTGYGT